MQEEQYQTLMQGMKAGDYLFVGFGHNDEKADEGRYTNPNGNYLTEGSFANSLYVNYVKPAQEKGVTVVLCTPIVRRTATGIWEDSNLHVTSDSGEFEGGNYAEAIVKWVRFRYNRCGYDNGLQRIFMMNWEQMKH